MSDWPGNPQGPAGCHLCSSGLRNPSGDVLAAASPGTGAALAWGGAGGRGTRMEGVCPQMQKEALVSLESDLRWSGNLFSPCVWPLPSRPPAGRVASTSTDPFSTSIGIVHALTPKSVRPNQCLLHFLVHDQGPCTHRGPGA